MPESTSDPDRNTFPDLSVDNFLEDFSMVTLGEIVKKVKSHVMITNVYREILWVNESFCERTGYSRHEVLGRKPHEFLIDPDACIPTEESSSVELRCKTKYSEQYWVQTDLSPVYNEENILIGFTAVSNEITEKKLKDELLLKQKESLKEAARQRLKLLQGPVAGIRETVEMLKQSGDEKEKEDCLKSLSKHITSIEDVISDLSGKISGL